MAHHIILLLNTNSRMYLRLAQNLAVIAVKIAEWCRRIVISYYDTALNLTNSTLEPYGKSLKAWRRQSNLERVLNL